MILGLFGVSWVMPRTVLGLLGCWQGSFSRHQNGYIWSIIPHCLMWCLWRERNSRCFEDYENSIPDLKLLFFRTLRDWLFALQYSLNNNLELTKCSKQRNATQAENNIHSFTQFYIKSLKKKNRSDMNSHVQLCHYCFSNSI